MKRRSLQVALAISALALGWWLVTALRAGRTMDEARYDQLLSARRSEARFMLWQRNPWFGRFSKLTGFDPVAYYRRKSDELEQTLLKSGALITVTFYQPASGDSRLLIERPGTLLISPSGFPYFASIQNSGPSLVKSSVGGEEIMAVCRPCDFRYWQSAYCCLTNRVSWGPLRKLGGNREEVFCRLPDGQVVELEACQRWLNESVAAGWMVGVCRSNDFLLASRRQPDTPAD